MQQQQQSKDEQPTPADPLPSPAVPSNGQEPAATLRVQKIADETPKVRADGNSSSILSLLKGKDGLQSSILELIQELVKKKRDIQHATVTLIRDQQDNDLLIKV